MSTYFVPAHIVVISLASIVNSLRSGPGTSLKGLGVLHDRNFHHADSEVAQDFHVVEI
jgi:hypothetical protein